MVIFTNYSLQFKSRLIRSGCPLMHSLTGCTAVWPTAIQGCVASSRHTNNQLPHTHTHTHTHTHRHLCAHALTLTLTLTLTHSHTHTHTYEFECVRECKC